jgi:hypothetical protein
MKTITNIYAMTIALVICIASFTGMGCGHVKNGKEVPSLGGCKVVYDNTYDLWNCSRDTCAAPNKCVLQIKKPKEEWKDIPGGNLGDDDLPKDTEVRCACK